MSSIDERGWAIIPGYVNIGDSIRLKNECEISWENGDFHRAGTGKGKGLEIREEIRRDQVMWLLPGGCSPEQGVYLEMLERLRLALNERFFLGLFEFEGHFAIYPDGGFYKAHLDRHSGSSERIVTVILYLNPDWKAGDGGELKLWTLPGDRDGEFILVEPRMGTLVCFISGDFWHEVLPTTKARMSITGWFRIR
jgi:SM-20-related protein